MNRRQILAGAPLLAVAGCAATAASITSGANTAATAVTTAGQLAVTSVGQATDFWGTVKGIANVAIAGVSIANPALAAMLTGAVSVGDELAAALPSAAADANALASGIAQLVQHGAALITQAGTNIEAAFNGITA